MSLAQDLKSLNGRMAEMESTLLLKIENQTKKGWTESTPKEATRKYLYRFSDKYYYHDMIRDLKESGISKNCQEILKNLLSSSVGTVIPKHFPI